MLRTKAVGLLTSALLLTGLGAGFGGAGCDRGGKHGTPEATAPSPVAAPVISELQPPDAPVGGLPVVFIVGEGFDPKRRAKVTFGDKPSPRVAIVTKNKIQVEVPPGTLGPVDVTLEMEGAPKVVATKKFAYVVDEGEGHPVSDGGASH